MSKGRGRRRRVVGRNGPITVRSLETGEVLRVEGNNRGHVPEGIKKEVWARDGLCCRYCGFMSSKSDKFQLDHIHPWSRGGRHSKENMVVACRRCNVAKGNEVGWTPLTVKEAKAVRYIAKQYGKGWRWLPDKRCLPKQPERRVVGCP